MLVRRIDVYSKSFQSNTRTYVAIIQNMLQDVSTRRFLSTAEYKVRSNQDDWLYKTEEVTSDEVMNNIV